MEVGVVGLPAAPANLTAEAGNQEVTLRWDDPEDPSIIKYKVSTKRSGIWGPYLDISDTDASTVKAVLGNLINGNSYEFQIRAVNVAGEGPTSAIAGPVTPAPVPDAPSNLSATPGDQQITLTWDDPGDASITGYEYRLSRQGATWPEERVTVADDAVLNRKVTITGLKNGVAYNVRLRAVNAAGPGPEAQIWAGHPRGASGSAEEPQRRGGRRQGHAEMGRPARPQHRALPSGHEARMDLGVVLGHRRL